MEYDHQPQGFFEPDLRDFEQMMQTELDRQSERSREAVEPMNQAIESADQGIVSF